MYKKFIGDGINSELKNSTCNNVLNVVRALVEDKDCEVYIPLNYVEDTLYKPNGDPRVHFYPPDCGRKVRVVGMQSNQERYSFTVMTLVDVMVESYDTETEDVEMLDKKVWRQFNIIRDGKLCMDYICATLSEENFNALKKIDILYYNGVKVEMNHKYKPGYVYKIMLTGLPLISYNWANPITIGLYDLLKEEAELSSKLKKYRKFKKENEDTLPRSPFFIPKNDDIYVENYTGVTKDPREPHEEECIIYCLKDVEFEDEDIEVNTLDQLNDVIHNLNENLRRTRFLIRCIVYAIESTEKKGSYNWSEPVKSSRSEKYTSEAIVDVGDGQTVTLVKTWYKKKF